MFIDSGLEAAHTGAPQLGTRPQSPMGLAEPPKAGG